MNNETVPSTNFKQEIGRRIAIRRRELGLTQKALSERASLSYAFLTQVEIGRLEVNAGDLPRLCVVLGVPVSYFFNDLVKSPTDDPMLEAIRNLSTSAQGELTPQDKMLLYDYNSLDEETQALVRDVTRAYANAKSVLVATRTALITARMAAAELQRVWITEGKEAAAELERSRIAAGGLE